MDSRAEKKSITGQDGSPADITTRINAMLGRFRTASEAVKAGGCSKSSLRRYRIGEAIPPFDVTMRLAAGAGVRLDWLATGSAPMLTEALVAPEGSGSPPDTESVDPKTSNDIQHEEIDFVRMAQIARVLVSSLSPESIEHMSTTDLAQRMSMMYRALTDRIVVDSR